MERQYFAAKEPKELASYLDGMLDGYVSYYQSTGVSDKVRQSYDTYYGSHFRWAAKTSGSSIGSGGRQGEFKLIGPNQYRNFLKHLLNMITSQKPTFDAKAINSDPESLLQAKLATQIIPALMAQHGIDDKLHRTAEASLVTAEGYLAVTWSMDKGKAFTAVPVEDEDGNPLMDDETGSVKLKTIKEGDLSVKCLTRADVVTDPEVDEWENNQWVMYRTKVNRYDLAAQHPEQADLICALPVADDPMSSTWNITWANAESPYVWVYHFYHKHCDALVKGRYMEFVNEDLILTDGPNPYGRSLPVFRMVPSNIIGSQRGYSDAFDLLPVQQAYDTIFSAIFTNQSTFGVQSILVPETCNLTSTQVSTNLAFLKYNPAGGKPEPLQLTSTPAELFKFLDLCEHLMEMISGVNSVARGSPDSSLKSGVALGLVQSMAIQYASGFQREWVKLLEDVATFVMELFQNFATTDRFIAIAGRDQRSYIKAFQGKDLDRVERMTIELGNPLSQTLAGRVENADKLLQAGMIPTPQEYLTVMETGQLAPAVRAVDTMMQLVHQENDDLLRGIVPIVLPSDNDQLHMQEHQSLYNDPEIRRDPRRRAIIDQHWKMHEQNWAMKNPVNGMIAGQPPIPPGPVQPPPQPMPPAPGTPGGPVDVIEQAGLPLPDEAQLYAPNVPPQA